MKLTSENFTKAEHAELDVEAKGTNAFKVTNAYSLYFGFTKTIRTVESLIGKVQRR